MKQEKTFLKIGIVLSLLIIINEVYYSITGKGIGLTALIIVQAILTLYIFFYLSNNN